MHTIIRPITTILTCKHTAKKIDKISVVKKSKSQKLCFFLCWNSKQNSGQVSQVGFLRFQLRHFRED